MSDIRSKPTTKEYAENYDRIFGKKKHEAPPEKPERPLKIVRNEDA